MSDSAQCQVRLQPKQRPLVCRRRWVIAAVAFALLAPVATHAGPERPRVAEPPVRLEIAARKITAFEPRDPSRTRFGALVFRGGLELTSRYREFGGISALRVAPDGGRFLAVTDRGRWWRGRIVYDGDRPVGITDAEMAPILDATGRPLAARGWYDSESIAIDRGTVYVGIERVNQIVRFDYGRYGLAARGQPIAVPRPVRGLPNNKGLECLEFVPRGQPLGGTLIAISERGIDAAGNLRAFLIGGPSPGGFAVRRTDDFEVSDCVLLASGNLLILERRFSILRGVGIRIRRIALASIRPDAVVDGPGIFAADLGHEIDNMEGLSTHRTPAGDIVLTLVSDDNFSPLQRTILLQFTLEE